MPSIPRLTRQAAAWIIGGFRQAGMVRSRIPGAQIDFQPNPALQPILDKLSVRFDDRRARQEWGWAPQYSQEQIVDDFLNEMRLQPQRYA